MWVLIKGLPEDAAVWRQDKPGWTQQDELLATIAELQAESERRIVYWLQVVAAGHGRIYKDLTPEVPEPLLTRFDHPDRPKPPPAASSPAGTDDGLPPKLTPQLARAVGLR